MARLTSKYSNGTRASSIKIYFENLKGEVHVFFFAFYLTIVGKGTVAENFGENGKSNKRKDVNRASAGEIRRDNEGFCMFSPRSGSQTDNGVEGGKHADVLAIPLKANLLMEKRASRES